ncbi:hypothetical protein AB990_17420 [Alkalihalobacillus pseudalcaliphilus]|nr:hypothetical protein AB990_17420 [Alkalihalobacillus pseudalcaliphilus]
MFILFLIIIIVIPILMQLTSKYRFSFFYDLCAYLALVLFSTLAATYIYDVLNTGEVFMTTIHSLFLNPYFLITGGYIGLYVIFQLFRHTFRKV